MNVEVTITGRKRTGKSAVAQIIHDALEQHGVTVTLTDSGQHVPGWSRTKEQLAEDLRYTIVNIRTKRIR